MCVFRDVAPRVQTVWNKLCTPSSWLSRSRPNPCTAMTPAEASTQNRDSPRRHYSKQLRLVSSINCRNGSGPAKHQKSTYGLSVGEKFDPVQCVMKRDFETKNLSIRLTQVMSATDDDTVPLHLCQPTDNSV